MGSKARRAAVTLAGLTLAGGAVVGMTTPASAATPTGTAAGTQTTTATRGGDHDGWRNRRGHHGGHGYGHRYGRGWQNWGGYNDNDWEFEGLFRNRWACERAGQFKTRWSNDDYVCVQASSWRHGWGNHGNWNRWGGPRGGVYALYVED